MTSQAGTRLPRAAQIGRTIAARYRLERLIGEGCMGVVYQAWDLRRSQSCAVKILHPESGYGDTAVVRFADEAQLVSRLCHPNIVEIWDYGRDSDGRHFLVMELLPGQSLYSLMQEQGPLPVEVALDLIKQVGSALHAVHLSGIVHRDLKPQNILLIPLPGHADRYQAKVIDFGLAKLADHRLAPQRGSDGMLIGTASYLAPEAWRGISAAVDARADQWALAVIAYRMLSGRLPYEADDNTVALGMLIHYEPHTPLRELVPHVPQHVQDAIERALLKDKEQRFPNVLQLVQALHQLPSGDTLLSLQDLPTGRLPRSEASALYEEGESQPPYVEFSCTYGPAGTPTPALSDPEPLLAGRAPGGARSAASASQPAWGLGVPTEILATSAPLPASAPGPIERRRSRGGTLQYLLPALSLLGALSAWSGVWVGAGIPRPGQAKPPHGGASLSRSALGSVAGASLSPAPLPAPTPREHRPALPAAQPAVPAAAPPAEADPGEVEPPPAPLDPSGDPSGDPSAGLRSPAAPVGMQ